MTENHHENDEKDETAWDISRLKTTPPWFWRLPRNFFITPILFSINRKREQPSRKPLLNLNIFSFYTYKWDSSLPSWSVCHPFFNKIHWTIRPKFKTEDWLSLKLWSVKMLTLALIYLSWFFTIFLFLCSEGKEEQKDIFCKRHTSLFSFLQSIMMSNWSLLILLGGIQRNQLLETFLSKIHPIDWVLVLGIIKYTLINNKRNSITVE